MFISGRRNMQDPKPKGRIPKIAFYAIPVIVLVLLLMKDRSPFGGKNSSFAIKPDQEITGIEFTEGSGTLRLEQKGDEWFVNDRFETRKTSILFILRILKEIRIKSPVAPELFKTEVADKNVVPVRVKVFERRKTIRSFLVYKTGSNIYGNIMKMKSGSKPFIVYVPGSDIEIGSAFNTNELFWQPYTVFSLLPSEIAGVILENMTDTSSSFSIFNSGGKISLSDPSGGLSGWDTSRAERYLSYFTHVPFETWATDLNADERMKIINSGPLYRITLTKTDGAETVLLLWERQTGENGTIRTDTDRLWAKTNAHDDIFIIRYMDIDPILKKRSYFFPG
jgi:hypothetical protein